MIKIGVILMKTKHFALILSLTLPLYLAASSLAGIYQATGYGPTNEPYTATVTLDKISETLYSAIWKFEDGVLDVGTGVINQNSLSFVFFETDRNSYGTQLYKIDDPRRLEGPWVRLGGVENGFEKLKRINHCDN